jgi:hypothetical protein
VKKTIKDQLIEVQKERDALRDRLHREINDFNNGGDAAEAGKPLDDTKSEIWQAGYCLVRHDALMAQWTKAECMLKDYATREIELSSKTESMEGHIKRLLSDNAVSSQTLQVTKDKMEKLKGALDTVSEEAIEWQKLAAKAAKERDHFQSELSLKAQMLEILRAQLKSLHLIQDSTCRHTHHYRSLVSWMIKKGDGITTFMDAIGEPSTIAQYIWDHYKEKK